MGRKCGYRMLSNLSKAIKGQEIQQERAKDRNRLYCYLKITQTLKDNQLKRKQRGEKKTREGRRKGKDRGGTTAATSEKKQTRQYRKQKKEKAQGWKRRR